MAWWVPVLVIAGVIALAMVTARLPGDLATVRAVQGMGPGPGVAAAAATSLVTRPALYLLLAAGLALAWWRAGVRGLVVTGTLMLLWWFVGEPLKVVVGRLRPSPRLVDVVGTPHGFSFPSTFATMWSATWLPVLIYAWRAPDKSGAYTRPLLTVFAALALLAGAWARVRVGAHWPSDLLMTYAMVWGTFAVIDGLAARVWRRA